MTRSVSTTVATVLWLLLAMCPPLFLVTPRLLAADHATPDSAHPIWVGIDPAIEILRLAAMPARMRPEAPEPRAAQVRDADPGFDEERRAVFDFHAPDAGGLFAGSRWILLPDRFGFVPAPAFLKAPVSTGASGGAVSVPQVRSDTFFLVGHLRSVEPGSQVLELHGTRQGPSGSFFTIDGFVRPAAGGWVLDAVYSVAVHGAEQIGRVRLRLAAKAVAPEQTDPADLPASVPAPDLGAPADPHGTTEARDQRFADPQAQPRRHLWGDGGDATFRLFVDVHPFKKDPLHRDPVLFTVDEPDDIEGIPVHAQFDVELTGTVDGVAFGPLPALLMFSDSELTLSDIDRSARDISVLVHAEGFSEEVPGTIILTATDRDEGWEVQAADGTVTFGVHHTSAAALGSLRWTTLLDGDPTIAFPVRVDATLSVDGKSIDGVLEAEGYLGLDGTRASRYAARIRGAVHENPLFQEVLSAVGVLPLTGDWRTDSPRLGVIRLGQKGKARVGTFGHGAGTLDGAIIHDLLRFRWTEDEGAQGWGFLRPLPGGDRAIGLWGAAADRIDAATVLATQPRQPWDASSASDLSDEEVDLLRKLGRDLAGQGRCTQALSVLDLVWHGDDETLTKMKASGRPAFEINGILADLVSINRPMIECAFELGRFETTLKQLRRALYVLQELNPLTRARHTFDSRVTGAVEQLRGTSETIALLLENLDALRSPKIGISLESKAAGQPLIIDAVSPDSPASRAGLKPGEEIIAIHGEPVRPLDLEEALRALSGAEGASLTLLITSAGEQREVVAVRDSWHASVPTPERRAQLEAGLESLRTSVEETPAAVLRLTEAMARAEAPLEPSAPAFDAAFQRVIDRIDADRTTIQDRIHALTTLGESLFGDWDQYMPTQRYILHIAAQMMGEAGQVPVAERPRTVDEEHPIGVVEDEMIHALFADPTLSFPEKALFYEHFKAVVLTLSVRGQLKAASQDLERWKRHAQPTPEAMAAHARDVARFSHWLERWRERLALDQTKIAALDAASTFAREWLAFLWDLEPKSGGVSRGGAAGVLLAAEAMRTRALQDLLAARGTPSLGRQGGAGPALVSADTQAPLGIEELVDRVRERGGTTVVYQALDDRLLVWVLDAATLSCQRVAVPETDEPAHDPQAAFLQNLLAEIESQVEAEVPTDDSAREAYDDLLQGLRADIEGQVAPEVPMDDSARDANDDFLQDLQDDSAPWHYDCRGIEARELSVSAENIRTYADVFQYFASLQSLSRDDGSAQAFAHGLHYLYERLIAPIADLLPAESDTVVTLIPDAELFQIPFGALVSTPVTDDLQGLRYLIEDHPIVYLTAIGMMRFTQENSRQAAEAAPTDLVTFWDPVGIDYSGQRPFFEDNAMRSRVEDLLTAHFPAGAPRHLFSGPQATRDNLFEIASRARVLTFFTHAAASEDPADDRGSYIALAGAPLTLGDVYDLDLHADLAILAGCVTGRGRIGADGVIGLSRAFMVAGAPTLAMTLWDVPMGDTLLLLDRFYRAYLSEGKTKAQALRHAQMAAISDLALIPQPSLWAGAVLFGEP